MDFYENVKSILACSVSALKVPTILGKAARIQWQSSGIWHDKMEMCSENHLLRGGSEALFVWVPCPLPSLGSHKLACCSSLPDGLAPAGVCLYIQVLTGGCEACSFCDVRCWECSLEGNR